jgi:hypothetical protein
LTSTKGSIDLFSTLDSGQSIQVQNAYLEPCLFTLGDNISAGGLEAQYASRRVEFFQLLTITPELGLNSTLLSVDEIQYKISRSSSAFTAPPYRINIMHSAGPARLVNESFIVADGCNEPHEGISTVSKSHAEPASHNGHPSGRRERDNMRLRLNWKTVFKHIFMNTNNERESLKAPLDYNLEPDFVIPKVEDLLKHLSEFIDQSRELEILPISTL